MSSPEPKFLSKKKLLQVIDDAPLASIDLIVRDANERVLLGWRKDNPAKDTWFVPGGRIRKGETHKQAFVRILGGELGVDAKIEDSSFWGVFNHDYRTNFEEEPGIGTQFVVLAYEVRFPQIRREKLPDIQHSKWKWFTVAELLKDPDVDRCTKEFFREPEYLHHDQYPLIASRRQAQDALLWQTPVLSLTAQAFLLAIALHSSTDFAVRFVALLFSIACALSSLHLMWKHRVLEVESSKLLHAFECAHRDEGFYDVHCRPPSSSYWKSSYRIWKTLLWVLTAAAILLLAYSIYGRLTEVPPQAKSTECTVKCTVECTVEAGPGMPLGPSVPNESAGRAEGKEKGVASPSPGVQERLCCFRGLVRKEPTVCDEPIGWPPKGQ